MWHKLADTAARRLRRERFSQVRHEQAVDRLVAAYVDWREESIAAREAYSRCDATRGQDHRHALPSTSLRSIAKSELPPSTQPASSRSVPSSPATGGSL